MRFKGAEERLASFGIADTYIPVRGARDLAHNCVAERCSTLSTVVVITVSRVLDRTARKPYRSSSEAATSDVAAWTRAERTAATILVCRTHAGANGQLYALVAIELISLR